MNEYELAKLLEKNGLLNEKINEFLENKTLSLQKKDFDEIKGHIQKAEHNLKFVHENLKLNFLDWCITGCYYSCYHAALSAIISKGYSSKNHFATLCILIKEFYQKELEKEDIEIISNLLDYQDILFYVESKNKREDSSYSSNIKFSKEEVNDLKMKSSLFVAKIKEILK